MTLLQGKTLLIYELNRDVEYFAEKGVSDKRQKLRYEHYEEKRQLKIRAIQNVLQKIYIA